MKQKDSTTWQLDSIDELRPRCKASDKGKKKYRFHCPLCGDEQKHLKRTDGAFDEEKGVGHCFCCGANFFASKWTYQPQRRQMPRQPEISLGDYPSSIMAYLKERGLKPEVMHRLGVGWAELPADTPDGKKTFLAFRFLEHGLVFNVQYKSPDKEFRFEKDCRIAPYNIDAVLGADTVYITEGMMDAAVLVQCGYESVISLPNGCGTRMSCFDPYREHFRGVKIVYAGDTDPKGVEKRLEVARYFADNEFRYVEWAEGKDANDVLMAGGEDLVRCSIEDIIATATQLVRQKGIRTLLIDPFNYIELPVLTGANDTQKISHVLRQIVDFAHQYKVLVILVAHPKKPQTDGGRKGESQMPSLYDIAGSADFYNKCDYGLILQRQRSDEYTKGATLTWIHVLKIRFRHLGQIGRRAFGYDSTCGRFVGTRDDNLSLREYDRSDWSVRAPEQQQLAFEAPDPEDDLPF